MGIDVHEYIHNEDERRFNEYENCKNCKMSVDGITWDLNGGLCPSCKRKEKEEPNQKKRKGLFW